MPVRNRAAAFTADAVEAAAYASFALEPAPARERLAAADGTLPWFLAGTVSADGLAGSLTSALARGGAWGSTADAAAIVSGGDAATDGVPPPALVAPTSQQSLDAALRPRLGSGNSSSSGGGAASHRRAATLHSWVAALYAARETVGAAAAAVDRQQARALPLPSMQGLR